MISVHHFYDLNIPKTDVIKITNPDYGYKSYSYDIYNNVIKEINEVGNKTWVMLFVPRMP